MKDFRRNFYWRAVATVSGFFLFGLGGFIAALIGPLLVIIPSSAAARRSRIRRFVHYLLWLAFGWFRLVGVLRFELHGDVNYLRKNGTLVVSSHPSLIDVVALMSLIPNTNCVVRASLRRNPFLGMTIRCAQYIPNTAEPQRLLDECVASLQDKQTLIIFPGGTRHVPGTPMKLKRGAARIAIESGAPVVPVAIHCQPRTLIKGEKWYKIPRRQLVFRVTVGTPDSLAMHTLTGPPQIQARELTDRMKTYFLEHAEY